MSGCFGNSSCDRWLESQVMEHCDDGKDISQVKYKCPSCGYEGWLEECKQNNVDRFFCQECEWCLDEADYE